MTSEQRAKYSEALDILESMADTALGAASNEDALVALFRSPDCAGECPLCKARSDPDSCVGCPGWEGDGHPCQSATEARARLVDLWVRDGTPSCNEDLRGVVVSGWREAIDACREWLATQPEED